MTDSKPTEDRDTTRVVLIGAVGLALYLLLGIVLWWLLNSYVDPTAIKDPSKEATAKKDLIQALGFIMAAVAGAVGIFFTWRNLQQGQASLRLTRETQEQNQQNTQAQLDNAQEELRLTRQGQITERFTRAIDQLGSEKLEIRLGGIYALERIDKESPERAYHGTVMEVLTAYVRENSRGEPEEPSTSTTVSNEVVEQDNDVAQEQDGQPTLRGLSIDIQAILDVLIRREEECVPEERRVILDLRHSNLQGADLAYAFLQGAFLQQANLYRANLYRANLFGANLEQANLGGAHLDEANLEQAKLFEADLAYADLQGANLQQANLFGAILGGARRITEHQIEWTIGSNETDLPEDLNRPELWSKSYQEQVKIVEERFGAD